ncbi:serine/threonine-protein kinase [Actinomadura verrucosospora]|uniref:serine/threonine-protein kinase n=1 Tax=Actinomadura verrucosospora TaxID=46165 RepID=UPI001C20AD37|nr:serine/threonine-protein kinase [Actinomadura verrucosospora]
MRQPVYEPLAQGDPPEIGGYRILARLGAGGMGRVFLGSTQSGRHLAIKVVRPEFADDPEFRRRFAQEVVAAQRVQNLYTAPVIDADLNGPVPWLATAHIPGPSLAAEVAGSGPLPRTALPVLGAGIAEALQAIHRAGVVHRDLKPSNVLLAGDGPRVIDFGIARAADATPLTRTGGVVGSPQFMAPEQVRGGESGPALDVFAFGALLYFAATARSPFGEGNPQAVMFRIVQEEPRLDECPDELRPLIERCLDKDPENRPSDDELLDELSGMRADDPAAWPPEPVTESLRAYAAVPPTAPPRPPTGAFPTGPHTTGSHPPVPAGPPGPPQPPRQGGDGGRVLLLVGGGVLALLLVFTLILVATRNGDGDRGNASEGGASPTAAVPAATQQQNEPPAGSPAPSAPVSPTGGDTPKPPGTFLGEYKGIDITDGYYIDFTDDPKRPKEGADGDLNYDSYQINGNGKLGLIGEGEAANYKTCHANTKYQDATYDPEKGQSWCVYTDGGLLGIIHIRALEHRYMTIDLKVWQGPAD